MLRDIIMPRLGDTSEEGSVDSWSKGIGDEVEMGEVVCTVSQDKASFDLESPYDGTLVQILVTDGQTVPVGTPIGRLEQSGFQELNV